jgi:hypothetical protein
LDYAEEDLSHNGELDFDQSSLEFDLQELEFGWQHRCR